MSTQINVKCVDQTLTLKSTPLIASGDKNEDTITFAFCSQWDKFTDKTAVFYRNKNNIYYSMLDENNTCVIPCEVLKDEGLMYFGVFASNSEGTKTSEVLALKVVQGAITENLKPSDPTPDIYEQILAKLQEIREAEATFETNITNQQNTFESKITEQQNSYEASLTKKENDFESDLNSQWSTYKTDLTNQQNTFESNINDKAQKISDDEKAFETKITNQQNNYETDLSGQWSTYKSDTDAEIKEKLSKVYRPCGSVANYDALPKNAEIGDVYNLLDTGVNWAWTGTEWDSLAGTIDLSNYYNKTEVDTKLNTEVTDRENAISELDKAKQDVLVSGTNLKTVGGNSLLGSGNIPLNDKTSIVNMIYPVGSIYMSVNSTSPATLFGGTWVQLQNRFLLGSGSKSVNATGGEENHTLSTSEMPSHSHSIYMLRSDDCGYMGANAVNVGAVIAKPSSNGEGKTGVFTDRGEWSGYTRTASQYGPIVANGSGGAHNNMPPYLVVNMWKRTA